MTPEGWKELPLSDIATIVGGGTPSRSRSAYWDGDVPWATPTDVTGLSGRMISETASMITETGLASSSAILLPPNSLLMTTRATIGACAINRVSMATNQGFQNLVPQRSTCVDFLYYLIHHHKRPLERLAAGSTFLEVSKRTIRGFRVRVPPLPEQRKIAVILSSVDDAIEKTQAVIDQVQVVKRGLMRELLTWGLPGKHVQFRHTEIGQMPEDWDVSAISDLCDRMFVGIAQAATHAYSERGVPIVRTTNLRENHLDAESLLLITDEFAREMKNKTLCGGDVLTARTGYPGTSVVVPESLEGAQCFTLLVSRPGPRLRSRYLCHTMNSEHGRRIVSRGQAGGAQQNLNVSVFKKARIRVPSLEEQDAICDVLDACYMLMNREESWKGALLDIKSSLMSALLTGELRVSVDTEAA